LAIVPWIGLASLAGCVTLFDFDKYDTSRPAIILESETGPGDDSASGGPGTDAGPDANDPDCTTTITGVTFDPSGHIPLMNVLVYVPGADASLPDPNGAHNCNNQCASVAAADEVRAATVSNARGEFKLQDVPTGPNLPVVIQVGRWRRLVTIPTLTACQANVMDPSLSRLPHSSLEGNIPRIAIATGSSDPIECLMTRLIAETEFSAPGGTGRIHLYRTNGLDMSPPLPSDSVLLGGGAAVLDKYDQIVLACEGGLQVPPSGSPLVTYADNGGQVFLTHYRGFDWIDPPDAGGSTWATVAQWQADTNTPSTAIATVDPSTVKGFAFRQWLDGQDASTPDGGIELTNVRYDVVKQNAGLALLTTASPKSVQLLQFRTPVESAPLSQCGTVTFASYHTSAARLLQNDAGLFPSSCNVLADFTPQEMAIIFSLFDLPGCVQNVVPHL
jgi:hypothetical protein